MSPTIKNFAAENDMGMNQNINMSFDSASQEKSAAPEKQKLTRIAELILASDARAIATDPEKENESRLNGRKGLAASLGCRVEDIDEIAGLYEDWEELVVEERVRLGIDSVAMRDASWDRLEAATMRKLLTLVETGIVRDAMELLAIAKAANQANRGKRNGVHSGRTGGTQMTQIGVGIGFNPGNPDAGVLPSGNLGTIQLRLSHRVQRQIEHGGNEVIDGESTRVLDSIEMLDLTSIQEAAQEEVES